MQGFDKTASINQIISDFRLTDNDSVMVALISGVWDSYADKAAIYSRLQDLYTRRHVLDRLQAGDSAYAVDWEQAGVSEKGGSVFKNLTALRDQAHNEILRLEAIARANQAPAGMAQMTATAPRMAPAGYPDPNGAVYRGDPLCRGWRGW